MPPGELLMEGQQKKIYIMGRDCEVETVMRFLKDVETFEEI